MKEMADVALNTAKSKGASYADIRFVRVLRKFVSTREDHVTGVTDTESYGYGIRALVDGTWGFAASSRIDKDTIARIATEAVSIARANKSIQKRPIELVPEPAHVDVWQTPITKDPFRVPIDAQVDLLLRINKAAMKPQAGYKFFCNSQIFSLKEEKIFVSTDGTYTDQTLVRVWPTYTVTAVDEKAGTFETLTTNAQPMGKGYEYVTDDLDLVTEAESYNLLVVEKSKAKSVEPGRYDLVLDPQHLWLTIHESIGHPTELDRVLGFEANFAGTSFATTEKLNNFQYGSKMMNIVGDKIQRDGLATCGYDDDGVKTKSFNIIKDGMLVGYQTIRDNASLIGQKESSGCCYADNWSSVPFQRMPNVSLQPAPGDQKITIDDLTAGVDRGILIDGNGSFSIDQQRYNFQFGGQLFYEIKGGKKVGMLRDVAYQSRTPDFWATLDGLGSRHVYQLGGSYFDGKGEPGQINAVSHGCPPARFRQINVINTGRKLG
ncbi:MAG TPA: TldD/PmbA family protein [Blastocatellia bacterium]|nr:TldD/PmbA family protein [Blastocatellia bacterium]